MTEQQGPPSAATFRIALGFAADLQAGKRPLIELALDSVPPSEWAPLLHSLLIAEINARRARGEVPLRREYLPRFPAHTHVVRAVFPESTGASSSLDTVRMVAVSEPPPRKASTGVRASLRRWWWTVGIALVAATTAALLVPTRRPVTLTPGPAAEPKSLPPGLGRPDLLLHPPTDDPERALAEWVIALGGRGTLALSNGGRRTFGDEVPLPRGKFAVTGVSLPPESAALWAEDDLERFRGRTSLVALRLYHSAALTDAALTPLGELPLTSLELDGTVRVGGRTVAGFQRLKSLSLLSVPQLDDEDMAAIGKLARLESLAVDSPRITPKGLAALKNPALRSLVLGEHVGVRPDHIRVLQGLPLEEFESHAGMTDNAFLELAVAHNLKRVRVRQTTLTDESLKAVLGLGRLEELRIVGSAITGPGLEHLEERTDLRILDLTDGKVEDAGLAPLAILTNVRELRLANCPITDQGVTIISQIDGVQTLDLGGTEITDTSLKTLRKHPTLKELVLTNTRATIDWVRDFERATPNCRVVWSPRRGR